jgi:hypothetical protein
VPPTHKKNEKRQNSKKSYTIRLLPIKRKKAMPAPIKDPPYVFPTTLAKTDTQRIKELKRMLIEGKGEDVVKKVLDIALEDGHPGQMAALKMCMDRALPASLFEKTAAQRSAINITISTLGAPQVVESAPDDNITDVEAKDV